MNVQTLLKMQQTRQRLKKIRRDELYELIRLARRLRIPPWGGPNGAMPLHLDEWRDSVASVVLVGHRARSTGTVGDSKELRLKAAIKNGRRVVRNKVRDRLLLWERFLFLLAQLREEEFVSCYCRGNFETVCLTILDFPSIFIETRTLEQVAKHLLPNGCAGMVRLRTKKKKRQEEHPRFKGWVGKLPEYLEELSWDVVDKPKRTKARQQLPGGNGSGKGVKILAKRPVQAKKKIAPVKAPRRVSSAKKSAAKLVARAKTSRPTNKRKQLA